MLESHNNLQPIDQLRLNDENPRLIKDERFAQLVQSLIDFPEMLRLRPTVADENGLILGGNMRTRAKQHLLAMPAKERDGRIKDALKNRRKREVYAASAPQEAAYRTLLTELFTEATLPVHLAQGLSEAQKREFIIKDNHGFGENDWDALANGNWGDAAQLHGWGMDVPKNWGQVEVLGENEISLPSGEKPAFKQMTFTLADHQAQDVETALRLAKEEEGAGGFEGTGNENGNGNALAAIVAEYLSKRNG